MSRLNENKIDVTVKLIVDVAQEFNRKCMTSEALSAIEISVQKINVISIEWEKLKDEFVQSEEKWNAMGSLLKVMIIYTLVLHVCLQM